jgi:hypothetical protein
MDSVIRYVTRWALSTGIRTVRGQYTDDGKYFICPSLFISAKEVFETLDAAKEDARRRAAKKGASLIAQGKKLSDPKWEPKVQELRG